jgi:hypothetical protein
LLETCLLFRIAKTRQAVSQLDEAFPFLLLVVDPNAVPPCLIALQRLEPITGRNREIFESRRDVERL